MPRRSPRVWSRRQGARRTTWCRQVSPPPPDPRTAGPPPAAPLPGRHTARIEASLDEAGSPGNVRRALAERLRHGQSIPGFGHPLYPGGDPRGRMLFTLVRRHWPVSAAAEYAQAVSRAGRDLLGEYPTLDYGLVMLR